MPRYATVKITAEKYKEIYTEDALRKLIANKKTNGFYKCIHKIGGKIIINLDIFEEWIEEHKDIKTD